MKRILVLFLAIIFMLPTVAYAEADENKNASLRLALVEVDTGAVGSSVNYFVLRPLMEYDNREGIAEGTMFDGLVFSLKYAPANPSAAEDFIAALFKEGTCIPAADDVAGEMKADGFLAKEAKYPIYVDVTAIFAFFDNDAERKGFYEYYVDTLTGVFKSKAFENIKLKGVYFGSGYDSHPDLRSYCIAVAKEKGLESVASSLIGNVEDATSFGANEKIKDQLAIKENVNGYTLLLDGVPDESHTSPYDKLSADYGELVKKDATLKLLVRFKAFNDVYDCASAIENSVPNENGRKAYELLKAIIDGSVGENSVEEKTGNRYGIVIAVSCLAVAMVTLLVYTLYRKGKSNDKKQRKR